MHLTFDLRALARRTRALALIMDSSERDRLNRCADELEREAANDARSDAHAGVNAQPEMTCGIQSFRVT